MNAVLRDQGGVFFLYGYGGDGLKILICDKDGKSYHTTKNVVFKEVFNNLS